MAAINALRNAKDKYNAKAPGHVPDKTHARQKTKNRHVKPMAQHSEVISMQDTARIAAIRERMKVFDRMVEDAAKEPMPEFARLSLSRELAAFSEGE